MWFMKNIVIVGASSGLGYGVAKLYIESGWRVTVAARRVERLDGLVKLAPERVRAVALDVASDDAPSVALDMLGSGDTKKCRRRVAVIDWKYWFLVQFWKVIPDWIWERLPWKL